ncbi:MAG TPA: hypothetical protein VGS41_14055 [Chthonomonadales bacterium]|nr:hypothetical protein [Chthonomonadales bacterium]
MMTKIKRQANQTVMRRKKIAPSMAKLMAENEQLKADVRRLHIDLIKEVEFMREAVERLVETGDALRLSALIAKILKA